MDILTRNKFATPVAPEQVEADWAGRGYSCHRFVDPPGREWNGFVHATNEVVTVIEGRLRLRIGEDVCEAEPGDEVFIPRDAVHSVKNISGGTTRWLFGYD